MTTTLDRAGRLLLPKEIRRLAGLMPKMLLEVRYRDGRIEIEPLPLPVRLVRKRGILVAVPRTSMPPLTATKVEAATTSVRSNRPNCNS